MRKHGRPGHADDRAVLKSDEMAHGRRSRRRRVGHVLDGAGERMPVGAGEPGGAETVEGEGHGQRGSEHRTGGHLDLFQFRLLETLRLGAAVLKPDLHLGLGQVQGRGEFGPFGDRQVLSLAELPLQSQELLGGERGSRLPVRLVLPQQTLVWTDARRTAKTCKQEREKPDIIDFRIDGRSKLYKATGVFERRPAGQIRPAKLC